MRETELYKAALLDHYRNPRNKGDLADADVRRRGSNPRCGDEVEIGIYLDGETLKAIRFRGRGCSICLASASMMTEAASGLTRDEALQMNQSMQRWFGKDSKDSALDDDRALPTTLQPLEAVRDFPARQRCVLLAWDALTAALKDGDRRDQQK